MARQFIFKDTETGRELVLPVTPGSYDVEHGRKAAGITMQESGDVNLPGPAVLLDTELTCLLPAQGYPFNQPGAGTNPWGYLEQLEKWSDAGTVLRFVVSGTPVNAAVLLDPIRYREQDGTGDLYCTIPLRGYRALAVETTESRQTGNGARTVEAEPERAETYTVAAGDTLSAICRRFYGDATLYGRLAAANGIANPNLIHPGQVLRLPAREELPAAATPSISVQAASATTVAPVEQEDGEEKWTVSFPSARELMEKGGLIIGLGS